MPQFSARSLLGWGDFGDESVLVVDLHNKSPPVLEHKPSDDIATLTKQLQLAKAENDDLKTEVQTLVDLAENLLKKSGDKKAIQDLVLSNKEKARQIVTLQNELSTKSSITNEKAIARIATLEKELAAKSSSLSEQLSAAMVNSHNKNSLLQTITIENSNLHEQLHLVKVKTSEREAEVEAHKEKLKKTTYALQETVEQNNALLVQIEDMRATKNSIEEKNVKLVKDMKDLTEVYTSERTSQEQMFESFVRKTEEAVDSIMSNTSVQLQTLETRVATLTKALDETKASLGDTTAVAEYTNVLLQDKAAENVRLIDQIVEAKTEIADLSAQLHLAKAKMDELEAEDKEKLAKTTAALQEMVEEKNAMLVQVEAAEEKYVKLVEDKERLTQLHATEKSSKEKMLEIFVRQSEETVNSVMAESATQVRILESRIAELTLALEESKQTLKAHTAVADYTNVLMQEKAAKNANLLEQIQLLQAKMDEYKSELVTLGASNMENTQQIALLHDELATKNSTIDYMNADIQRKTTSIDEKAVMITDLCERIEQHKSENVMLQSEIKSLFDSCRENAQQMSVLEDELSAKRRLIDEMNADIHDKNTLLEEKTSEVYIMTKKLKISEASTAELTVALEESKQSLINIKATEEYTHVLLQDKTAKNASLSEQIELQNAEIDGFKLEIKYLFDSCKENVQQISVLESELLDKKTKIDKMNEDMQEKIVSLEAKDSEITAMTKRLEISKNICDELKSEVKALVAIHEENTQQISALEDDLAAKMIVIDEMVAKINDKNTSLEEKAAETADLVERLQLSKAEKDELMVEIKDLVACNEEKNKQITELEVNLATQRIAIDELGTNNQDKSKSLEEKVVEINDLKARLQSSMNKSDELKTEIKALVACNNDNGRDMALLKDDLGGKIIQTEEMMKDIQDKSDAEIADLNEQLKVSIDVSDGLKKMIEELEMKNTANASEIMTLQASLEEAETQNKDLPGRIDELVAANTKLKKMKNEMKKKNAELMEAVQRLTKTLGDERSIHETKLEEMNLAIEKLAQVSAKSVMDATTKMSELKATIDDLTKSLNEATVELERKDKLLEESKTNFANFLWH
jgi:chromosome segregation ATPase